VDGCRGGFGLSARGEVRTSCCYVVVFEQTPNNWAAYVPDLPGCVATGGTREETEELIREAVALHVESLLAHNESVPKPGVWTGIVEVPVPAGVERNAG
jgi:predicted RNase H-like HicB family nuclease